MTINVEEIQKVSKEAVEKATTSIGVVSKGFQSIATETADYSKKSFEAGSAFVEQLLGVKAVDKAIELQTAFAKSSYEGFVAQAKKVGEMYVDIAKEAYKPFEGFMPKAK